MKIYCPKCDKNHDVSSAEMEQIIYAQSGHMEEDFKKEAVDNLAYSDMFPYEHLCYLDHLAIPRHGYVDKFLKKKKENYKK